MKKLSKYSKKTFRCNTQNPIKGHESKPNTVKELEKCCVHVSFFTKYKYKIRFLPLETALDNH